MSTRYVWEKSDVSVTTTKTTTKSYTYKILDEERVHYVYQGDSYAEQGPLKEFVLTGSTSSSAILDGEEDAMPIPMCKYVVPRPEKHLGYPEMLSAKDSYGQYHVYWTAKRTGSLVEIWVEGWLDSDPDPLVKQQFNIHKQNYSKGSYVSLASNASRSAFSDNGISAENWYVYKGSDIIDPILVSYSKSEPEAGDPITIAATPRTPTYGGTISYQYQYSIDGGKTWTNIGNKTTATSKTVTIPEGAEQFQARVLASDGWGFTSTTYVYGPSLPVSQIKAYATVGGKLAAGAKMYATMGGKIRQIQKGYATVGGKIRKLF